MRQRRSLVRAAVDDVHHRARTIPGSASDVRHRPQHTTVRVEPGALLSLHPSGGSTTRSGGVTPHLSPRRDRGNPGWNASTVVLFLCYGVVQTY